MLPCKKVTLRGILRRENKVCVKSGCFWNNTWPWVPSRKFDAYIWIFFPQELLRGTYFVFGIY